MKHALLIVTCRQDREPVKLPPADVMFRKSDGKARCLAPTCSRDLPGWSSVSLYGHIPCLVSQTCLVLQTHRPLSSITDPQTLVSHCLASQTHKPLYHRPSCITDPQTLVSQTVLYRRPTNPCITVLYHRPTNPCITDRLVSQTLVS